ncbi:MAG: hypothetical protein LBS44_04825, partial [Deltaproteobacteria bacterium]|jgi:hypothetical protein|nr:hypothetical protein [Deltaproteobacteria bacterium]
MDLLSHYIIFYQKSLKYKELGYVYEELKARQNGTKFILGELGLVVYNKREENLAPLYALGLANEAVTLGYHLGDGLEAYEAAKETLNHLVDKFGTYDAADERLKNKSKAVLSKAESLWMEKNMESTPINDVANIVRQWTGSYEDCLSYVKLFYDLYPAPNSEEVISHFQKTQAEGVPWWQRQLHFAYHHYNRESPQLDKGFYAPAMSILQCILKRMKDRVPGYELDQQNEYATYLHLLDDYVVISHKYVLSLLVKHQKATGSVAYDLYDDFYRVLKNPLGFWLDFMPDMRETDRPTFSNYFEMYMMLLGPFKKIPEELKKLETYFPKALEVCKKCGKNTPISAAVCVHCSAATKKKKSILSRLFGK